MQRLMKITVEMQQPAEGHGTVGEGFGFVFDQGLVDREGFMNLPSTRSGRMDSSQVRRCDKGRVGEMPVGIMVLSVEGGLAGGGADHVGPRRAAEEGPFVGVHGRGCPVRGKGLAVMLSLRRK